MSKFRVTFQHNLLKVNTFDSRDLELSRGSENCSRYREFEISRNNRKKNYVEKVVVFDSFLLCHTICKQLHFFEIICNKFLLTVRFSFCVFISFSNWATRFSILELYLLGYRDAFCRDSRAFSVSLFEARADSFSSITI